MLVEENQSFQNGLLTVHVKALQIQTQGGETESGDCQRRCIAVWPFLFILCLFFFVPL